MLIFNGGEYYSDHFGLICTLDHQPLGFDELLTPHHPTGTIYLQLGRWHKREWEHTYEDSDKDLDEDPDEIWALVLEPTNIVNPYFPECLEYKRVGMLKIFLKNNFVKYITRTGWTKQKVAII
jgi:hypothetical protein